MFEILELQLYDKKNIALMSKSLPSFSTNGVSSVLYIPIFERQSYIFLYLEYSPIYSYIEMMNSYFKQILLISNMERCKFVILFNR